MNSGYNNTLYIILNYGLNNNIFKIISSIKKYCFSFLSLSLQYKFQLYIVYNNSYSLLFPNKLKDSSYFMTSNYSEIEKSILDSVNYFFNNVSQAEEKLDQNNDKAYPSAINIILKKIILELNQNNNIKQIEGDGSFFLSSNLDKNKKDKILIINDSENDFEEINQKYVFLLKKEKIKIDILSLNEKNRNNISKALCLFTNGFFDSVSKEKKNIEQILIQEFMPLQRKEIFQNNNNKNQNTINYNKVVTNDSLICSLCNKTFSNNEDKNEIFNNNCSRSSSDSNIRGINNSTNNWKYLYEKQIYCHNCIKSITQ